MSDALPTVTIIIAARPEQATIKALDAARLLDYPRNQLEILVARGKQPSVQRNAALRSARGELVYFLDDDSVPQKENLRLMVQHFAEAEVKMVGGPNVCPPEAPFLERVFEVVLSSWLAFGPSRARYTPIGSLRSTGEKELILCNLAARRKDLLELGGFNEALYPNEENALMDELQKRGGTLIYDPAFIVHRRPRRSLAAFARMLRTYGRGRAEQFRLYPTPGSALNFIPPLFCLYLIALALAWVLPSSLGVALRFWAAMPLVLYLGAVVTQTFASVPRYGVARAFLASPLLVASHVFYGLGFWRGLVTRLNTRRCATATQVNLEIIAH